MNCDIFNILYLRYNGDITCNDNAGVDTILERIRSDSPPFSPRSFLVNEKMEQIRSAFSEGNLPWPDVCARCAFLRKFEPFRHHAKYNTVRKIQIEPSMLCTLDCPGCSNREQRKTAKRPFNMPIALYKKVLEGVVRDQKELKILEYCGHGEPLMHPQFSSFITLTKKLLPSTYQRIITNGNFDYNKVLKGETVDEIMVSCDGAYQDSYAQYRKGGDVEKVFQFMRDAVLNSKGNNQTVVWKYILFEWSDSDEEVLFAQKKADEIGVDKLLFVRTHSVGQSKKYVDDNFEKLPIVSLVASARLSTPLEKKVHLQTGHTKRMTITFKQVFVPPETDMFFADSFLLTDENELIVKGWFLSRTPVDELYITTDGTTFLPLKRHLLRTDVHKKHHRFNDAHSGFETKSKPKLPPGHKHEIQFYKETNGKKIRIAKYKIESGNNVSKLSIPEKLFRCYRRVKKVAFGISSGQSR